MANVCVEAGGSTSQLDGGVDAPPSGIDAVVNGVDTSSNAADAAIRLDVVASGADADSARTDASVDDPAGGVDAIKADADVAPPRADASVEAPATGADAIKADADAGGVDLAAASLPFQASNLASTDTTALYIGGMLFNSDHCGSSTTATINTDTGSVGCSLKDGVDYTFKKTTQADSSQVGLFLTKQMQISRTVKISVSGSLPLVIVASDSVVILGTLYVPPGSAGGYSGVGPGDGNGPGAGTKRVSTSGAGASFCGKGGKGGVGTLTNSSGKVYAVPTVIPLIGGSSGGSLDTPGGSGAGGGAIQIISGGTFQLDATGAINVGGGGAGSRGGGGGSGGAILIEALNANIAGTLAANGGGGSASTYFNSGGGSGTADAVPAHGEMGGDGSAGTVIDGGDGKSQNADDSYPGGGGGGAGVIRINSSTPSPITTTAVISPAIGSGCASVGQL
ncbi:MAG: hypothetical protein WCG85_02670 [Polyangia bacterium]